MPPLSSEWSSRIPKDKAPSLLEQEEELKVELIDMVDDAGKKLRGGRREMAEVRGPKAKYRTGGQGVSTRTEAWLSNNIRFSNSEIVSLHTREVIEEPGQEESKPVEGSERTQFTVRTHGGELESDQFAAADVQERIAYLQDAIETLQLIDQAVGESVLVPLSELAVAE